jgi:DnaJ-class molecular chaperone
MTTAYEVLGVDANADEATIRAAFRSAAKECHPDLNGSDSGGERRLRRLIAAREVLTKPKWRHPQDGEREHSPGERWSVIAATAAGAVTLLLLVYMSQQWVPRIVSF